MKVASRMPQLLVVLMKLPSVLLVDKESIQRIVEMSRRTEQDPDDWILRTVEMTTRSRVRYVETLYVFKNHCLRKGGFPALFSVLRLDDSVDVSLGDLQS